MYNWKLEFILKCGKELTVYYKGAENNSGDVAIKTITGNENIMSGFMNEDGTKNIFVKIGEIASVSISKA